jgi:anthranilate phosphoribosyltransferase
VLGTFSEPWALKLASTLGEMGTPAGLAVVGLVDADHGIDELTTATVNRVRGAGRLAAIDARWGAEDFGLPRSPFSDLLGGDVTANLAMVEAILAGRGPAGLVDTIVLNAAAALWVVGRAARIQEGIPPVRDLLLGGAVRRKIAATREFYRS